jgi:hypothetical protein
MADAWVKWRCGETGEDGMCRLSHSLCHPPPHTNTHTHMHSYPCNKGVCGKGVCVCEGRRGKGVGEGRKDKGVCGM